MVIIDIINDLERHQSKIYPVRSCAGLTDHVVHHSTGRPTVSPQAAARWHVRNNNWPGIGYSMWIAADGTVYQVNLITTMSWATAKQNHRYFSTCLSGDFCSRRRPTDAQIDSLWRLHNLWLPKQLGRRIPLIGHKEGIGQHTSCPGDYWGWRELHGPRVVTEDKIKVILTIPDDDRIEVEIKKV